MSTSHNWPVIGHDWAIEFLRTSLRNGRNRHAYLITGTRNIGKSQLAHAFAMALNCTHDDPEERPCGECRSCKLIYSGNHPDIMYGELDERSGVLKIDAIREVIRLLALKPYDSRFRVAIFHQFDSAAPRAQDALLKTLEEPSRYAVLLLLAQSTENIMPTITSRCQIIPLRPVPAATIKQVLLDEGASDEDATLLARLSSGRMGWALEALRNESIMDERNDMLNMLRTAIEGTRRDRFDIADELDSVGRKDKETLRYVLETWQTYWRDVLLLAERSPVKPCNSDRRVEIEQLVQTISAKEALQAMRATRSVLIETMKTNANLRMALEVMFLDYPGLRR